MIEIRDAEQRVATMIAEGRRIMDAAIAEYRPVAIVAAFSGGNDSVVSTHFAAAEYGALAMHCDTTTGVKPTENHVLGCAKRFGWDLRTESAKPEGPPEFIKTRGPDGKEIRQPFDQGALPCGRWTDGSTAYEEFVLNWGFPGHGQHHRMFQRLKGRPIESVQKSLKVGHPRTSTVMIVSGIRHDESSVRAGYKRDTQKEPKSSRVWVNPFYWRDAVDFEAYRQEFGLPRNPVRSIIGVSGECNCGAYAGNAEFDAIRLVDSSRADDLCRLDAEMKSANGYPWAWGQDPPRWYLDTKRGQSFLFPIDDVQENFRPMCVGCSRGRPERTGTIA